LSCVNVRSATALDGCKRTTMRMAYTGWRIPRASERRDSIAPCPGGSIERLFFFNSVLEYDATKFSIYKCTLIHKMWPMCGTRVHEYSRIRTQPYDCMYELVASYAAVSDGRVRLFRSVRDDRPPTMQGGCSTSPRW
jgi:hypothetical protein